MQNQLKSMEELFRQLPPDKQNEVRSYIEFLIHQQENRSRRQPKFDWAGALEDLREQYSSVDLQHQITSWRSETE